MRSKTGLIGATLVIVVVLAVFLIRMPHINSKSGAAGEPVNTTLGHVSKPSPAVAVGEKKLGESPNNQVQSSPNPNPEKAWPSDGIQVAAHHKGHNGCDGMLTLKASGLQFMCPGDSGKSFFVVLRDIRGVDQDGIVTASGKKYHFDKLPAGGKEYVEKLFADWLAHVRLADTQQSP